MICRTATAHIIESPEASAGVVRDGYDRLGERDHAWAHRGLVRRRLLREALDRLQPGSDVIELGCGPGDPVTRALAARAAGRG